ncbi:hypothetical protein ACFSQJ_05670 [Croceitalea marina]|uniref:DUF4145 domain-containing protein n=1 Tax=Croceitalea marina TaxID=1775166 RepID=A0ABW5MTP1_9FLAO
MLELEKKYKGIPIKGLKFYQLLFESEQFTSELGKMALAASNLEAKLIMLLINNKVKGNYQEAPLGKLIDLAQQSQLLGENTILALKSLKTQRNYLTHKLYQLFSYSINETIVERNNLLDSDVLIFTEWAWQLQENLKHLADIILKEKSEY